MAAATYPIISADSHITEAPGTYIDHIDAKWKDRAPKIVNHERLGDIFVIDGLASPVPMGLVAAAGKEPEKITIGGVLFDELHRGGWDPEARMDDQKRDGVAAEIIYPTVGMVLCNHEDFDYKRACMEAYNRWIAEYCSAHPDRLLGCGQVSMRSVADGIEELEAIAALGLRGVMMPGDPAEEDYDHPIYDPFWEKAIELGLPLSFHILTGSGSQFSQQRRGPAINGFLSIIRGCQDIMGMLIYGGVFERHPELRVVCVEADAGWVPHFMYRMDHAYKRHRYWLKPGQPLSKLPSEYFSQHIYTTFQDDWVAFKVADMMNWKRLMWANDFPHSDSTWPWSQEMLDKHTQNLTAEQKRGILCDNVAELYGIDTAALGAPVQDSSSTAPAELVLVGGGHAHVQVLRRFMMKPDPGIHLTVVLDRAEAVYSGMVPGLVAGDYAPEQLEIDVVPLARRARARVLLSAARRIDPEARRIDLKGRPSIRYDFASLDVGSTVRGLDLPGVREHAIATRPIRTFVDLVERGIAGLRTENTNNPTIAVVGAGTAGVELAFTLEARTRREGFAARILLLGDASAPLPGAAERLRSAAEAELRKRNIERLQGTVVRVEPRTVHLEDAAPVSADLVVWATGAAPVSAIVSSPLPKDAAGFVRIDSTLRVEGRTDLFAVGDCASLTEHPWVPKAGVYAVRQGPVLEHNLRAAIRGHALRPYAPQRDFLSLLNLGDRRALGGKWDRQASGRAVWHLKDRIDRRFMRRFQVLEESGALAAHFPDPEAMGMDEMPCGGCAAKLGASSLERALGRIGAPPDDDSVILGLGTPDDAAAVRTPSGDVVLATVDAFRSFTDDPWLVGRVAAVNAVSDVLAKGGRARHALALVTLPEDSAEHSEELLFQVLAGVRTALDSLGVSLVGGHTTTGTELFVGLSVTGDLADGEAPLPLSGLRAGDALILTKPLGTGVLLAADMQGRATGAWVQSVHASLVQDNVAAARTARSLGATACTDVSGFGLARHLGEMLRASDVSATVRASALPTLPGAEALLVAGVRSTFHEQNAEPRKSLHFAPEARGAIACELLFDPQTSGGLLFGVPASQVAGALAELPGAAAIGTVTAPRPDGALFSVES